MPHLFPSRPGQAGRRSRSPAGEQDDANQELEQLLLQTNWSTELRDIH
jgi:hypothetical protein